MTHSQTELHDHHSTSHDTGYDSREVETRELREFYTELGREILIQQSPEMFIDFDVEGDGPAGFGSLCSIGAIAPTGEEFYVEIKPQTERYSPGARAFCDKLGLTREYLDEHGVSIQEAALMFKRWVDSLKTEYKKPAVATAFNAGYDWAHIDLAFALGEVAYPDDFPSNPKIMSPQHNPFGVSPADTKSLALALPRIDGDGIEWSWQSTKKTNLPDTVNPDMPFTHNALDDAKYQQLQHFAMVGVLNADKDPALDEMIRKRIEERKTASTKNLGRVASNVVR